MDSILEKNLQSWANYVGKPMEQLLYSPFGKFPPELEGLSPRERQKKGTLIGSCKDGNGNAYSIFLKLDVDTNRPNDTTIPVEPVASTPADLGP